MESTSIAMKIQVSGPTQQLLQEIGGYGTELRGEIEVKASALSPTEQQAIEHLVLNLHHI